MKAWTNGAHRGLGVIYSVIGRRLVLFLYNLRGMFNVV